MITNMARFSAALVAVVLRLVSVAAWALFMSSGGVPPVGPPPRGGSSQLYRRRRRKCPALVVVERFPQPQNCSQENRNWRTTSARCHQHVVFA